MGRDTGAPSDSEWRIMEIVWREGDGVTSAEIVKRLKGSTDMTERTIRVLLSRLCGKGLLSYTVDAHDSRVYHYRAMRTRQECIEDKSRHFIEHYFSGNGANAIAAFIGTSRLTDEQIRELEELLNEKDDRPPASEEEKEERHG